MARGRACRATALVGLDNPRAQIFRRSLQAARRGNGPCHRLEDDRLPRLATNQDRWTEYRRLATTAKSFGMEMHLLSPAEVKAHVAADGGLRPRRRLLAAHRWAGQPLRHHPVAGQRRAHAWRQDFRGRPCHRLRHGRWPHHRRSRPPRATLPAKRSSTAPANGRGRSARWPASMCRCSRSSTSTSSPKRWTGFRPTRRRMRDPDRRTYFKEEVGGLVMGGYEPNPIAWETGLPGGDVPNDWEFRLFDDDFDHFEQHMAQAIERVPALANVGVKQMINGPESFTPDGNFILGAAPECSKHVRRRRLQRLRHRVRRRRRLGAGAMGGATARRRLTFGSSISAASPICIATGTGCATARWRPMASTTRSAFRMRSTCRGRPAIVSPLYERLKGHRAVFGSKLGWERPNWFAPDGTDAETSIRWAGRTGSLPVGEEHRHVREQVGIFDQSSFAKYEVSGQDALRALDWICANDVVEAGGPADLYATAQHARRHRGRPHRGAAGRGPFLHRHRHRLPHPRSRLDRRPHSRRSRRVGLTMSPKISARCR